MTQSEQPELLYLSNGIPVVLQHHDGLVAANYWWVKVGSADEAKGEEGFAHFLEHMLFKDAAAKETGMASSGKMARAVESLGGEINAYTSFDQTVYHVTSAAHHWEKVLSSFGEMARPQKFFKQDFKREREVILEELRKSEDSPERQLFQTLFSTTYARHPYGRPVIGYKKTLQKATVSQLERFYKKNYVSENMGLVLVGPYKDLDGSRKKIILKLLEKNFGISVLPKKKSSKLTRAQEPELRHSARMVTKNFDVTSPSLAFAFRVPDLKHEDIPALDLLAGILSMGELSRFYQKLFYQTSLVTSVGGSLYVPRDPGMFFLQIEVDEIKKINPSAEVAFQEILRIQKEGPTADELSRVIINSESERLYATQTADGMASRLGFLEFMMGDLNYDRTYLDDLKKVTAAKIQQVAKKYLEPRRMAGVCLLPKGETKFNTHYLAKKAEEILQQNETPLTPRAASARSHAKEPELILRPSGIRVVYRENPYSHVMSVQGVALGGLRLEVSSPLENVESDWGSGNMMSLTWSKGTPSKDGRAISHLVEGSAAQLDGFSGRNTIGLQLTGLARDWTKLSALYSEILTTPTFPDEEVNHSRRVVEDSLRAIEDHSSQLCTKLFLETLFEQHPYGRLTLGSHQSLEKINSQKLQAFHREWIRPERLVLSIVGAVKRADLEMWLDDLDERFAAVKNLQEGSGRLIALPEEPVLKAPRWIEKHLQREQMHLLIGGLGTKINSPDRYALRLLQTVLGGQSGRLFIELREKKSLAYSVAPISFEGVERGYVGTYLACAPQKKEEAIRGISQVLETLVKKGPTEQEMRRAKEYYLGRRMMELQSDSALAIHYGLQAIYGISLSEDREMVKSIERITPREIQAVCKKYCVDPYQVTAIVG